MNYQIFQQTGGFPLTTNRLSFLQASMLLMQSLGELAGDLTIISGCVVTGTQVASGTVYIEGELIPFIGGQRSDYVVIRERRVQKQFEDGTGKDVEVIREAMFGNGLTRFAWADFTRLMPIKELQKALTPVGLIAMWSGHPNDVPAGWKLCNGENGTPNLSKKFVRGFDYDAYRDDQNNNNIGEEGGDDDRALDSVNMPPHNHGGFTGSDTHSHSYHRAIDGRGYKTAADDTPYSNTESAQTGSDTHSHTISSDGGLNGAAQPFDNRPAFYTIAYIIYTGE